MVSELTVERPFVRSELSKDRGYAKELEFWSPEHRVAFARLTFEWSHHGVVVLVG